MTIKATGASILSATCYCESCRTAACQFEQAHGTPSILGEDGGVDYCLFRKDRVTIVRGGEYLREYRLNETSPTRRVVAECCHTPMFLDFTNGHWLNLYRNRILEGAPPLDMRIIAKNRPAESVRADGLPTYAGHPARFMVKLLLAWAAMGFRRPKVKW